jgi:hypothetical protein
MPPSDHIDEYFDKKSAQPESPRGGLQMIPVTFFDSFYRLGSLYGEFDVFGLRIVLQNTWRRLRCITQHKKFLGLRGQNSQTEGVRVNLPETFIVDLVSVFQTHHRSRDSHQK